jgi:ubiquinone/menaquinone biosynthesis C-methylase UbiE
MEPRRRRGEARLDSPSRCAAALVELVLAAWRSSLLLLWMTSTFDPFAKQAATYVLYRPTYPGKLLEAIRGALASSKMINLSTERALDVGCGSGQLTRLLASRMNFASVVGIDTSLPQLSNAAVQHNTITYQLGTATKLDFPSNHFALVTMAQMFHWVPFEQSLNEAKRVLKPGGVLAIISYAIPHVINEPEISKAFNEYYYGRLGSLLAPGKPGCLWDCDRRRVDSGYEGEDFGAIFPSEAVERLVFLEEMPNTTVGSFLGYLKTQSAYQNAVVKFADPLEHVKAAMGANEARPLRAAIRYHLVMMHK